MKTLLKNVAIVPMDGSHKTFADSYLEITDSKISGLWQASEFADLSRQQNWDKVIDGTGKCVMPGLVNGHTHTPMALLRGYGEGCNLHDWLFSKIFPAEEKLNAESVYHGAMLAIAEMLLNGITCFADQYFFCEAIAKAVLDSGIRANISRGLQCFDQDFSSPKDDYRLREGESLYRDYHDANDGQIKIWVGPHSVYTCVPRYLQAAIELAGKLGTGMHIHLSETADEVEKCIAVYGATPFQHCKSLGFFDSVPVLAAHCVHLSEDDFAVIANAKDIRIVHNPGSNLKLASGIAPLKKILNQKTQICLGTDGVASNNDADILKEIRLAATLAKVREHDPLAVGPWDILEMATRRGCASLGFDNAGTIRVGGLADLIVLDISRPNMYPLHDLITNIVYSSNASNVAHVFVNGVMLVEDGELTQIDLPRLLTNAQKLAERLTN